MFWKKDKLDREVREEMDYHLSRQAELQQQEGRPADEARNEARRRFGNLAQAQEETRRVHIARWTETVAQDVHYALRSFARMPAFITTAVIALALGIGASTAVFSVVDRILFRSLPYPHEDRLVWMGMAAPIDQQEFLFGADYLEWRERQTAFEAFTSWRGASDCDLTAIEPTRLRCAQAESTFLPTLGITPIHGRNFTKDEDLPNAPKVALLSHRLWRSHFGANPRILGETIQLQGEPVRLIGVLPRDFELPSLSHADIVMPQALDEARERARQRQMFLTVFGRLKPGMTLQQARASFQPSFEHSLQFVPPGFRKEVQLRMNLLRDRQVRDTRQASLVLFGAVVCVLLVACANVANLMLARSAARQREIAVRLAIGAARGRLIRQTLTESLLLSFAGGLLGIALAYIFLKTLVAIAPRGIPRLEQASLDWRVLCFTAGMSLIAGLLFGLAPALIRPRIENLTGTRAGGAPKARLRQALVVAQLAVSVVLLTGAGLLMNSLWRLQNLPLGLQPENILTTTVRLNPANYPRPEQRFVFFQHLEDRLRRLPNVQALAFSDSIPPSDRSLAMIYSMIEKEGQPVNRNQRTGGMVVCRNVTPQYFVTLSIPILRGRGFTESDRRSSDEYIILSNALAHQLFPGEEALGKRIRPGASGNTVHLITFLWYSVLGRMPHKWRMPHK